jgi:amino acid adenylation domain-containing protein/non-ribosomal peptide synthase protein (TIGR01720 family)
MSLAKANTMDTDIRPEPFSGGNDEDVREVCERLAMILKEVTHHGTVGNAQELHLESLEVASFRATVDHLCRVHTPAEIYHEGLTIEKLARHLLRYGVGLDQLRTHQAPQVIHSPAGQNEPFHLTPIQQAYLLGSSGISNGHRSAHFYTELTVEPHQGKSIQDALNTLIKCHPMLRATVDDKGKQYVQTSVDEYGVRIYDADALSETELSDIRRLLRNQSFDPARWPLFDVRAIRTGCDKYRLLCSFDLMFVDANSLKILAGQLMALLGDPQYKPPVPAITYKDVRAAINRYGLESRKHDEIYWVNRLDSIPPAPAIPMVHISDDGVPVFRRRSVIVPAEILSRIYRIANDWMISPTAVLCAAYAKTLRFWAENTRFTLNVTVSQRPAWHDHIKRLVGDFTGTLLLECSDEAVAMRELAVAIHRQLQCDLSHAWYPGVAVQRQIAHRHGAPSSVMPIVFTSVLGAEQPEPGSRPLLDVMDIENTVSQTPGVLIDCQAVTIGNRLLLSWDYVNSKFPSGLISDMFAAFIDLVEQIGSGDCDAAPELPRVQKAAIARRVTQPVQRLIAQDDLAESKRFLHSKIVDAARLCPEKLAVIAPDRRLTYRELVLESTTLAQSLADEYGIGSGAHVAILMGKGWEQVVAVLAVSILGGVFVPVDSSQPRSRIDEIIHCAEVVAVLVQNGVDVAAANGVRSIVVSRRRLENTVDPIETKNRRASDPAYIIFTSGSTATPKGVVISHLSALNTIADVNSRFGVTGTDVLLGLSRLSFDLAIYDIFGVLATCGTIVLPLESRINDPSHWHGLIRQHQVTVWNSVPALLELYVSYCDDMHAHLPASLRRFLLSGDRIPLRLPERVREATTARPPLIVALGGATEASIWSNFHIIGEIEDEWTSIPYGRALANQTIEVLDNHLRPRPIHSVGEIHIGGRGVATGYHNDPRKTDQAFIDDPFIPGHRLYKTGDLGRYLPSGEIEILGRRDDRVKISGNRIELAEVEGALMRSDTVRMAVVATHLVGGRRQLVALVVPSEPNNSVADLISFLEKLLPSYMVPRKIFFVDSLSLGTNGKVDRARIVIPESDINRALNPPVGPLEQLVAEAWRDVLPPKLSFGRNDEFFAVGGDSILAIRAVSAAAKRGVYLTPQDFAANTTISAQAIIAQTRQSPPSQVAPYVGPMPLTATQRWFFEQNFAEMDHWNGMWPVFEVDFEIDPHHLERALQVVVQNHESLRTRFLNRDGLPSAVAVPPGAMNVSVAVIDLGRVSSTDLESAIVPHIKEQNSSLLLSEAKTVALTVFKQTLGANLLLVSSHWIVMDYFSSRIFFNDLLDAYRQAAAGTTVKLPAPTASVKSCLDRLDHVLGDGGIDGELSYWQKYLSASNPSFGDLENCTADSQGLADRHYWVIDGPHCQRALSFSIARGLEARDLVLYAFASALSALAPNHDVYIELEGHGRTDIYADIDYSRTISRFSSLSPVRFEPRNAYPNSRAYMVHIQSELACVPRRGSGFGPLRYLHPDPEVRQFMSSIPLPRVGFNFWGDVSEYFVEGVHPVIAGFGNHRSDLSVRTRELDLMALLEGDDYMHLLLTSPSQRYSRARVEQLANDITRTIVRFPDMYN